MIVIILIIICLFALSLTVNIRERRRVNKATDLRRSLPKVETKINWFAESTDAEMFIKAYQSELEENDDYNLPTKELKEFYDNEKVYKYESFELPMKMDGLDVFSYINEGEWIRIGRLKKTADLDGDLTLYLYPNTYKYVADGSIEKEKGDSYFGVEVKRVTHDPNK